VAGIKDYSTTNLSNTTLNGISVAEGMLPSNLNNAIRALMVNTRSWYNDSQWVEYGDGDGAYTAAYASATSFTIAGVDVSAIYHEGRRIKLIASTPGTIYGTISSSSFSTDTTINVTWDIGSLSNEAISNVYIGALSKTNDSIPESIIDNAKVASSAAIDATKIHDGTISNTEFGYLNGVSSAIQTQLDAKLTASNNLSDLGTASTARTNLGLGTIATQDANNIAITGGSVTGMSAPSTGSDVTTKTYVDDLVAGLRTRIITRVSTTANIDLTADLQNTDTLDGITLATNDKVLVKNQTDSTENGIYDVVASGTATRNTDYNTVAKLAGQLVIVQEGSTNADTIYLCTTDSSGSIGSTNITFSQVQPQNTGTVTSVAVADSGSSEFTVTGSPITASGTINLAVNSIDATKIGNGDVDNTELSYVNGVTSAIQTQINGKLANVSEDSTPQLGGQLDVNGNAIGDGTLELLKFVETASAVNEFTITNNATGNNPILSATGDDTNIGIDLTTKGTGLIKFNDLAYYPEASITSTSNAVAWDSQAQPNAKHTTTENTTFSAPSNATTGSFISLNIQYGGSHTIAFNTVFEFAGSTAPTFTSVSGQTDHLVFRYNGTVWQEMGRTLNMSAT